MTTVTLRWREPDDAGEFLALRRDLRRLGGLTDAAAEALIELVRYSEVVAGEEV
jgi:hypothetical protein